MIHNQTVLGLIMARGGSKGLPRKNLRMLSGKPLLAWTIDAARQSCRIDRLVLSSEDGEIISAARELGCEAPFVRPHDLARDDTPAIAVVRHALMALQKKYDYLVLLQPTSPLRTSADIDGCLDMCARHKAASVVSVAEVSKSPYWMYELLGDNRLRPVMPTATRATRRQELPPCYVLNGAVFVARCDWISDHDDFVSTDTVGYVMPKHRSIDIDDELDLRVASVLLASEPDRNR
jgi:CMP-N,N'-diacetyllegionaminic acid synthase